MNRFVAIDYRWLALAIVALAIVALAMAWVYTGLDLLDALEARRTSGVNPLILICEEERAVLCMADAVVSDHVAKGELLAACEAARQ